VYYLFSKTIRSIKINGIVDTTKKIFSYLNNSSTHFSFLKTKTKLTQTEKFTQENTVFPIQPKISIITPLFNTPEHYLKEMIESVLSQTYSNWELCITDGSDTEHDYVGNICLNYTQKDNRIKYKKLDGNSGISENSNKAIEMSSGEYIGILDHDDLLHPSALYEVMNAICREEAELIYTDEAVFNNNHIITLKHHKPDFAIDTLRSCNYIGHFYVFSRKILNKSGTFRSEFDGSQDYDLILKIADVTSKIVHIPKLLYFLRFNDKYINFNKKNKIYANVNTAGANTLSEHLTRNGMSAKVESAFDFSGFYRIIYKLREKPLVSIIIPNKDHVSLLRKCISSIMEKTTYKNYEIIIIENSSVEKKTFAYYEELKQYSNIRIAYWEEMGFNYSKLSNFGVQYAKGAQLIFMNNDIEIITPSWIEEMLMYSQRDEVGAVGIKLFYPNNTIQHAGVILGIKGVAGHIFHDMSRNTFGYMGKLKIVQNMSAVTAACMMIKRSVFEGVGFFAPEFCYSYNDVDLCIRVLKAGFLNVWTPYAEAYHHESKTRGYPEKQREYTKEVAMFKEKWSKELVAGDTYYNCNFSLEKTDYSLRKT